MGTWLTHVAMPPVGETLRAAGADCDYIYRGTAVGAVASREDR